MLDFLRSDLVPVNALIFLRTLHFILVRRTVSPQRKIVHRHWAKVINSNFKFLITHHYSKLGWFWQSLLKQHNKPPGLYLVLPYPGKCFLLWIWKTSQIVLFFLHSKTWSLYHGMTECMHSRLNMYSPVFPSPLSSQCLCIILLYDYYWASHF